jgi:hypothetical protein
VFRDLARGLKPSAVKQGLAASREVLKGGYAGPTEEQLASLTPAQRAEYEANMAQVAEAEDLVRDEHRQSVERELARRALYGPAGEYVYGAVPEAEFETPTLAGELQKSKAQLKDVLRNPLNTRPPPPPPTGTATLPGDRSAQAAAERAARDAAREPYVARDRPPLSFVRLATRQKTQVEEVAAYLGSSGLAGRPDLVYGVYRVPDHIDSGRVILGSGSRVVEWDIVHAAGDLAPSEPATGAFFKADERWAIRREGEPAVLDEDLALEYLARADIGPERCLGVARSLEISQRGAEGATHTISRVTGVHAFHPGGLGAGVFEALRSERPLAAAPREGVHVEVLNWRAIARAIRPESHRREPIPSPFPYLPGTPQELLRAYIEVVGLRPADSYSAQVTEDDARDISGVSRKGIVTMGTNRGEKQPCADGEERPRLVGGSRVVVAYRDRPEYAEGRGRWATYERDVLEAALSHGTGVRSPVVGQDFLERGVAGRLFNVAGEIYDFVEGVGDDPFEDIPPHRYCWPPAR